MRPLDRIDTKILEILSGDGRITNQALSERVNLSPRACLDRMRRLEKEGFIEGYRAILGRRHLGNPVTVIAEVTLRDQRQTTMQQFERRALKHPEVIACYVVSGQFDYVIRFVCRDLDHYHQLTNRWTEDVSMGVARIASSTELQTVKEFSGFPIAL